MKRGFLLMAALVMVSIFMALPAMAFEPTKDVEVIVPSSAGGGTDLNARTIAEIIKSEKLSPANYMVINKPGGSGAVAYSYAAAKAGDNHMLMTIALGQVISSYVLKWDVSSDSMTPLAVVADDDLLICALAGRFKDMQQAIDEAKSGKLSFGSSQKANSDHLGYLLINKYANTKFKYVQFGGSGEVMSALLGKHVDVGIFNPGECLGQVKAGQVVPLATLGMNRMPGDLFGKAPTFKELGYPQIQVAESRVVVGPPKMSANAAAYYEALIKKVVESERWKKEYIERNNLTPTYKNAKETKEFLDAIVKERIPVFREAGF